MLPSVLALTVPFIFVIIIVWLENEEKRKRYQLKADLYAKALDKGDPIPTDLFSEPKKRRNRNPLRSGIICISVGIGISLTFWLMSFISGQIPNRENMIVFRLLSVIGIIPFLIGIAFIIIHYIEKKKDANDNAQ